MRNILAVLACVMAVGITHAQVAMTNPVFIPSPLGVALTIGQWIYINSDRVYYIEVAGEGATPEESRLNGFRLAVEQAVGSVIASETVSNNSRIARNEIVSYASGYVTKFEIVSQAATAAGYRTVMRVWIKRSNIANRLLHTAATPGQVNGDAAATKLATLQHERHQGDRLVNLVVNDFYRMGLVIQSKPVAVTMSNDRTGVLTIPFELKWNQTYLDSLWQALAATAQNRRADHTTPYISLPTNGAVFSGRRAHFDDAHKIDRILAVMVHTRPTVLLTINSLDNRIVHASCHTLDQLDHASGFDVQGAEYFVDSKFNGPRNLVFNSRLKLEQRIVLRVTAQQLQTADRIDLSIIPRNQCS